MSGLNSETFFFIVYPRGERSRITVVDLAHSVSYDESTNEYLGEFE